MTMEAADNPGMDTPVSTETTNDAVPAGESGGVENSAGTTPEAQASGALAPAAAPQAYQVNPVYKVRNFEKKFPDWLVPLIKDAETEKQARDILERADGLDYLKQDRSTLKEQVKAYEKTFETEVKPVMQTVQAAVQFRNQGDYDSLFQVLQVPKKEVLEWALKYAQMSPEARTAHDRASATGLQNWQLQQQAGSQQEQYAQQAARHQEMQLDFMCQRPDVASVEQAFDQKQGPGSFRDYVIRTGQMYAYQGKHITVEQAVSEVVKLFGFMAESQGAGNAVTAQPQTSATPAAATPAQPVVQQAKPVIPVIQGTTGASPAKQAPRSLKDLKELGKRMASNAG